MDENDYKLDNVVLACYWCNNAKTDEFSPNEFKEIARGINEVWKRRLAIRNNQEHLVFPENSSIWKYDYSINTFCDKVEDDC